MSLIAKTTLIAIFAATASVSSAQTQGSASAPTTPQAGQMGQPSATDRVITTSVKTAIANDKSMPASVVSVSTVDGQVTLSGSLETSAQVQRAIALAKSVNGVKSVESSGLRSSH